MRQQGPDGLVYLLRYGLPKPHNVVTFYLLPPERTAKKNGRKAHLAELPHHVQPATKCTATKYTGA
jgi:hypothetical protein